MRSMAPRRPYPTWRELAALLVLEADVLESVEVEVEVELGEEFISLILIPHRGGREMN